MKKGIIVFILVWVSSFSLFGQSAGNADMPEISIPVFKLDIGETPYNPDSTYLYKFPFKNVGTAPLLIIKTISGCSCVSVSFPEYPVSPGQVDTIFVHFRPLRAGRFTQRVAVISNAKENSLMQLYSKATFLKPTEINSND